MNKMKIVVIGGTGLIGTKLVNILRERGHDVVVGAPSSGVNSITGEGLAEAFKGAQVVVDVANAPVWEDKAVLEFFETSGRNLLAAGKAAGVKHHVALSVVGTDRLLASGYFRAKMAQESLIRGSYIPYTIVRSTQFFEFAAGLAKNATEDGEKSGTVRLSSVLMQPIAADDVAAALAEVAVGEPINGTLEIAGPEKIRQDALIRQFLSATGDARTVITDVHAGYYGVEANDASLVPGHNPRLGSIRFSEWLSHQAPQKPIERQPTPAPNLSGKLATAVVLLLCGLGLAAFASRNAVASDFIDSNKKKLTTPVKMNTISPDQNPKVDHNIRGFLKALNSGGGKPIETLTPAEARKVLVDAQASVRLDLPACDIEAKTIAQDGSKVSLTIVRPAGSKAILPGFIFVHGGGWILGDFPTHERFVRDLVADSSFTAVFVNYTPSPEAQYPTAINEIYAATKWVAEHGAEIKVDGRRLAIVGNSVGGNMTAAIALMASHKGGPKFKCQIMLWPVTDANFQTESYHEYADGYFLSRAMMMWFWDAYTPDAKRREIYASPLQATTEQLKGLPPALVQVAGNDVLRDEGLAYARKLDFAGVDVTVARYENLIHDYGLLNAISQVPAVRDALHQTAETLKKHLK